MALAAGTRLGPYEILSALGAGGMGEVYKARDIRLDRTVAVKVLAASLVADPQLRERFDREARAISQLTHPHICTLHDVGEHAGTGFLVMELLDGQTLAARLAKGALPLAEALAIATQIADALDAAHRHGIVHRDLKPANIMLTKSGAKLLDFGLAKSATPAVAARGLSMLPTTPPNLTAQGTILGTFQYMAPEQVEGLEADARTDLFGLGAVLYEMVTGRPAFEGKSHASLIAAILSHNPPPVSQAQPLAPAALNHIVATCLAKDPDERWQSARDLKRELKWVTDGGASTDSAVRAPSAAAPRAVWSQRLALATAAAALGFAMAWLALGRFRTPPLEARETLRFLLSEQLPAISGAPIRSFAISPDGRRVVYRAVSEGIQRLYLRELQTLEAKPIVGTENGFGPFFAPDGKRLGFFSQGALSVIGVEGGSPVILARGVQGTGATWAPDDTIIFSQATDAGLLRIPATGGTPQVVATPDAGKRERSYRWPHMLPGGDLVLFTIAMSDILSFDDARIAVRSLKTGEQHELVRGGSFPAYAAPGYLVYARAGALQAVRLNPAKTAVEGAPTTVLEGIATYPSNGAAQYTIANDGTLLYLSGGAITTTRVLTWVDRTGRSTPVSQPTAPYQGLSISPDGRFAAIDIDGANANIWVLEFARSTLNRFATPFGSFSPDGRTLAFTGQSQDTGLDMWVMPMDGAGEPRPFVQTKFNESFPRFSPSGRWLAYVSDETGRLGSSTAL